VNVRQDVESLVEGGGDRDGTGYSYMVALRLARILDPEMISVAWQENVVSALDLE
jgi:hypothetical protein